MTTHNLRETMKKKGVDFRGEAIIYEVCNPQAAKSVLEMRGEVSTALPCRISVYRKGGKYWIATIKPTALMSMFAAPELAYVAIEVEEAIIGMMQDAAG